MRARSAALDHAQGRERVQRVLGAELPDLLPATKLSFVGERAGPDLNKILRIARGGSRACAPIYWDDDGILDARRPSP
jgi:hypothetical protein